MEITKDKQIKMNKMLTDDEELQSSKEMTCCGNCRHFGTSPVAYAAVGRIECSHPDNDIHKNVTRVLMKGSECCDKWGLR